MNRVEGLYLDGTYNPNHNQGGRYLPSGEKDAERLFNMFARLIRGRDLLDIGAGAGAASGEAIRQGFSVRACEPSPQCRAEFRERNGFEPDASFFDTEYATKNCRTADVMLLSHVLEHLADPVEVLRNAKLVLKPGGVLIISVPHFGSIVTTVMGKRDFFITPPEHLSYFSREGLKKLLERNGYKIEAHYTSSKVNLFRYKDRIGSACIALNLAALGAMKVAEYAHKSIVLNVCARSVETD